MYCVSVIFFSASVSASSQLHTAERIELEEEKERNDNASRQGRQQEGKLIR